MIPDAFLKIYSEKIKSEFMDNAVPEPFKSEIQDRLHNLQSKANDLKDIETGGQPDHPLGEHPTLWMKVQYQAARYRAIKYMQSNPDRINSIKYDNQLVYPPFGFLLNRLIIRLVFILRKHRRASYPIIGLTEIAYLRTPTYLLKKLRFLLAKIRLMHP
jgi:hypothetical protein